MEKRLDIGPRDPGLREIFGTVAHDCPFEPKCDVSRTTNATDLWWASPAASEAGWGIAIADQARADGRPVFFATWFTYDTDGSPLWLSATANKSSAGVFTGTLYRTTGPAFNALPFSPSQVVATPVGTLTLSFASGDTATFAYVVNGVSQSKTITRQVFRTPGTLCQ